MKSGDWLGLVAGSLTTISFVPQVIKVWRSKSADDLSMGMFLIFSMGVVGWLAYGIVKDDVPVIVANTATVLLTLSILVMKIVFAKKRG